MPSKLAFTIFSSTARLAVLLLSSAPTGQNSIAQGSALGLRFQRDPSPEGATLWAAF